MVSAADLRTDKKSLLHEAVQARSRGGQIDVPIEGWIGPQRHDAVAWLD
jgi:hypothetical protein